MHKIFDMAYSRVYPLYVAKVQRKGASTYDLDTAIEWLTGYSKTELQKHLELNTTFRDFFAGAKLHPNAHLITGKICGVRIEEIEDPLMQKIRYLDKLVDEVANGRALDKVLRQ